MERAYLQSEPMTKLNIDTKIKLYVLTAYLFIIAALVYLYLNSPVTGYEVSIYDAILPFWILIIGAAAIIMVLIVYQVSEKHYNYFGYSFIGLLLCVFVILTLPISRGYYFYGGNDPNSHLLNALQIIATGHFFQNYYPGTHIFGSELIMMSGISAEVVMLLIPPVFTLLFIIFTYFLAKEVFGNKSYAMIATAMASIPLFSYYHICVYPHGLSIYLLPVIFYLYFKSIRQPGYRLIFIIILVMQAFVHIVPTLVVTGCLVCAEILRYVCNRFNGNPRLDLSFNPAIISFLVFFAWWSSYSVFDRVQSAYQWFIGEAQMVPRTEEVEYVSQSGQGFLIDLYIKMYGNQLVLTIISLIAILIILCYFFRRKEMEKGIVMSGILLSSAGIYVILFLSGGFMTIGRFFGANYGVWAMPVITAYLFTKKDKGKLMMLLIASLMIILFVGSVLSIYRSPWISQPNWHVTYEDSEATSWMKSHKSSLMAQGVIGASWGQIPQSYWSWSSFIYIPEHFGYDINSMFGESIYKDSLVYFGEERQRQVNHDLILNKSILSGTWGYPGFNDSDVDRLYNDRSVETIYSNGENKILYVIGLGKDDHN